MKPIQQFIEDPTTPEAVRRFLTWAVQGAANDELPPPLFANWRNCRVRVVTAKHTGFVGITAEFWSVAPRRLVSINDLSAFREVAYPKLRRARCRPSVVMPTFATNGARVGRIIEDCAARAGIAPLEFRHSTRMQERCLVVAELYFAGHPLRAIGRAIGVANNIPVHRCLDKVGVRGPDTMERRWLRSLWRDGPRQVGEGTEKIPADIAAILVEQGHAVIDRGFCIPALLHRWPPSHQQQERLAA